MAAASLDEYLAGIPAPARERIALMRGIIHASNPAVVESMAYGMPTFTAPGGHRFHLAAWATHLGVYPVHAASEPLESELAPLRTAKATVRFPLDVPFDEGLARRLVAFLLERSSRS